MNRVSRWHEYISTDEPRQVYWCVAYHWESFDEACKSVASFNAREDVKDTHLLAFLVEEV